jgi:translocation and assembly module TamA
LMFFRTFRIFSFIAAIAIFLIVSNLHAADNGVSYKVFVKGVKNETLLSDIRSISDSLSNADHQIASEYLLQKMADGDIRKFLQLLRARGFYDASVQSDIKTVKNALELTFQFQLGEPYILKSVKMELSDESDAGGLLLPDSEKLGLYTNKPFTSIQVLDAQDGLIRYLRRKGFPLAAIADREVVVDHLDQSVTVYFKVNTGQKAVFGDITISGLTSVEESYVAGKLPWEKGDPFNGDLIEEARMALSKLGLFATIRITEEKELGEGSALPIEIDVTERKHKSISVGLNYITNEGPGVKFSWENRNLFHSGERLTTNYELSNHIVTAEGTFKKQDFIIKNQTLRLSLKIGRENTDAYNSTSIVTSGFFDRDLTKKLRVGAGLAIRSAKVDQLSSTERFHLFSFPVYYNMDTTNDLLDPVRGYRFSMELTPYKELKGPSIIFLKALASYKRYTVIFKKPYTVFATNLRIGILKGAGREEIPADERFYAGGGGSIRGYSYQSVGPLFGNVPIGGKSLIEVSTEVRFKITEHIGLAAFLDGGSAFTNNLFSSGESLSWGTGMGLRYYTPVGPLRLDVARPINKRPIDSSYQMYLSLGQAF